MDILADTKPENYFITKDGQKLRNLSHLHKALLAMSDDVFSHHVNRQKNDFYNWVRDVYKDAALSNAILNCRTKQELSQKIKLSLEEAVRKRRDSNASSVIRKDTAVKNIIKKDSDVRNIISEAKKETEQKIKLLEAIERPIEIQQKKEPVKEVKKEEAKESYPKTEKQVFVEKPPRTFTNEERVVKINSATYVKASAIDLVFGVIIGVIVILIIKQLF